VSRGGVLLLVALLAVPARASAAANEYEIKATFLLRFAQFVEWPADAARSAEPSFTLCVLGEDPFGKTLEAAVAGEVVDRLPIRVQRLASAAHLERCRVVFFSRSTAEHSAEWLSRVARAPVLTVGDSAGFAASGGDINFVLENDRVRFEINPSAARLQGLTVSSRLLGLARIVTTGQKAP
jgi:hypothetical protein